MYGLDDLVLFTKVVEIGSFSNTAKALKVTSQAVANRIRNMESRMGVVLIHATTREFKLTEAGQLLYGILQESSGCVDKMLRNTEEFVKELKDSGILIVSGLAYGVDILSHKVALDIGLNTVGVLGHGLDRIYPHAHERIAKKMIDQGGLLTDFISQTNPDAVNFPKRNRIVAGMCDALVIVESKQKGGSLITATIANSYNKDVFAFPGRAGDALAEGCNGLIKQNKAGLIENAADLLHALQWENITNKNNKQIQVPLMLNINEEEKRILDAFSSKKELHIDEVCYLCGLTISKVAATLLQLEFNGIIKSKPGKMYLCNV